MKTAVQNGEFRNKAVAIRYVMDALAAIDSGKTESFDFVSSQDVTGFCKANVTPPGTRYATPI